MARQTRTDPSAQAWHLVGRLAASQYGVVSRSQMRALGLGTDQIDRAVRAGRLHRVYRGVYAVGYPRSDMKARMRAATLACGDGSVISHRSAAALLGLVDVAPVVIHVIAPGSRGRTIDGIRAHLAPLARWETGEVDGIPCAAPARVLVDIAGELGMWKLRGAFERAAAKGILDVEAIEAAARPTRGVGAARRLAAHWRKAAPLARKGRLKSPLEAMVLPLVVDAGAAPPLLNAPVRLADGSTIEVDFLWPEQRFALEADSRDFHSADVAVERDRWRDRELVRVGYSTPRVTHQQARSEADAVAAAVIAGLRSPQ